MKIALLAAAAALVLVLLYLSLGSLILRGWKRRAESLTGAVLLGFFAWFALFEIVCLVCEVTLTSFGTLVRISAGCAGAILAAGILVCCRDWLNLIRSVRDKAREHGLLFLLLILATGAVCFFALIYTDASADADYYIGMASTASFTNSIGRFNPTTGKLLRAINPRYAYALYPYFFAVVADLFRIPVIVAARMVMSVLGALMTCLSAYFLGKCLFLDRPIAGRGQGAEAEDASGYKDKGRPHGSDRWGSQKAGRAASWEDAGQQTRKADLFTLLLLVLHLFSATIYLPGSFLFARSFEGKHMIANVALPCLLALCILVYRKAYSSERQLYLCLFLLTLAGVSFSSSAILLAILAVGALLPLACARKSWPMLGRLFLAVLPILCWAGLYVLNSRRVFVLLTYR